MAKGETKVTETKTENLSDALLWLVRSLSKLFLVSILGSMVAVSLAMGVGEACPQHEFLELVKVPFESRSRDVPDSSKKVEVGPHELPLSALPFGCVVFAALMLWLTRARMRTIEDVLTCKDTRPLARVLFRINPPLLDVINTDKPSHCCPINSKRTRSRLAGDWPAGLGPCWRAVRPRAAARTN